MCCVQVETSLPQRVSDWGVVLSLNDAVTTVAAFMTLVGQLRDAPLQDSHWRVRANASRQRDGAFHERNSVCS
jgi:hypothetical protein